VNDQLRTDYIKRHIDTAMQARKDGANLYVDFDTQERIPKQSFYEYKKIIASYKK